MINLTQGNGAFLECRGIKKSFELRKKKIQILQGIDFSIKKGELIVIIGKSGVGKSTLLSMLGGLERPTEGSIFFNGRNYSDLSNEDLALMRAKQISMICQNFNLVPSWNAFNNVEAAMISKDMPDQERAAKIETLFSQVGLGSRLDNLPSELSEGEQQRVSFLRAMVVEPELVLADEPTGDVDPETAGELIKILFAFLVNNKVSLVASTNMEFLVHIGQNKASLEKELSQLEGKVYVLSDGILKYINDFQQIMDENLFLNGGNFYEKYV